MGKTEKVAVIGLGKFGTAFARDMASKGYSVCAMDVDEDRAMASADLLDKVVVGSGKSRHSLAEAGFDSADVAVVSTGDNAEAAALCVMNLKSIGVPRVWAKAKSEDHKRLLEKVGADYVVIPEIFVARQLTLRADNPGMVTLLDSDIAIREIRVDSVWAGKTLRDLNLRGKRRVQVVAVKRDGINDYVPDPDSPLLEGDCLMVIGTKEAVESA